MSILPDSGPGDDAPYFFLAYAHTPEQEWVGKLFRDLRMQIYERTTIQSVALAGFMDDTAIPLGSDWRERVAEALARCRIFVPLYSPRYFTRPECGKEWHAFAQRILDHKARSPGSPTAIIPALWTPVDPDDLPDAVKNIQFNHATLGVEYAKEGFYTLIKNSYYQEAYTTAVQQLAKQIISAAEQSQLRPCRPADLGNPRNAFSRSSAVVPADRRLVITVAAPTRYDLPDGRGKDYYGERPHDWNPYHPVARQALADYTGEIARLYSYEPTVTSFDDEYENLMSAGPGIGLGVLLVDAWALSNRETRRRLHAFAGLGKGWIGVIAPWNRDDPETMSRSTRLRDDLHKVLERPLDDPRGGGTAVRFVPTLDDFSRQLPMVIEGALYRYLTDAPAHPPGGTAPPQPRLTGPTTYITPPSSSPRERFHD